MNAKLQIYFGCEDFRIRNHECYKQMFECRTDVFHKKLGWDVHLNEEGYEMDKFDTDCSPTYFVLESDDGSHICSARLLPASGPNMLNILFLPMCEDLGEKIGLHDALFSEGAWEVSRLCMADNVNATECMREFFSQSYQVLKIMGAKKLIAALDRRIEILYRRSGFTSNGVVAEIDQNPDNILIAHWSLTDNFWSGLGRRYKAAMKPDLSNTFLLESIA